MALIRWNQHVWTRTLLAVAALFVCFCTLFMSSKAEAKSCRLMSIESHEIEIDGRAAVRIQIGVNRAGLSYTTSVHAQRELHLALEDVKFDKKFPLVYAPSGTLAAQVAVRQEGKNGAVLTVSAAETLLHEDSYRVHTIPGEAHGKVKEYLVIDIITAKEQPSAARGHTVVIDPGHGGSDSGAVGYTGVREKDVALAVARYTEELLHEAGAYAIMTRTEDVDVAHAGSSAPRELQARVDVSLAHPEAELFLSVHCNSFTNPDAHGMETYYYPKTDADEHFAALLNEELAAAGGLYNRGIKYAKFYVLRHTEIPAALVELGFLSNPEEEALLADAAYQKRLAQALVRAIERYFEQRGEE